MDTKLPENISLSSLTEYFIYLDDLRESGKTNMFGAAPFLFVEFEELSKDAVYKVLSAWMETFGNGVLPAEDRADKFFE